MKKIILLIPILLLGFNSSAQITDITIYGEATIEMEDIQYSPSLGMEAAYIGGGSRITIRCNSFWQTICMTLKSSGPIRIEKKLMTLNIFDTKLNPIRSYSGYITNVKKVKSEKEETVTIDFGDD